MEIQWYPGHMTKARRMMEENIKLIDLMIEIIDARVPISSRNPDIDKLSNNKSRLILINKADLADPRATKLWLEHFKSQGIYALEINSKNGNGIKAINAAIKEVTKEKVERDKKRGIIGRPIRAMVSGIPNVGKSTFINAFSGKASTKTGNKPGVTKGKQWITLNKDLQLLDTPGILWPKFDDPSVGTNLALIGSVNDEILEISELSLALIDILKTKYPGLLHERYEVNENPDDNEMILINKSAIILEEIAKNRKCLGRGGSVDYDKAARILIDEIGRASCRERV